MPKERFRNIKRGKVPYEEKVERKKNPSIATFPYAKASQKIKAFLTDSFMLMMPILYVVIYMVMGGREGFEEQKALGWAYIFVPLVIVQTLFMIKTSQTPGYKAYNIYIIDNNTGEKPSAFVILFRNLCAVLSFFSVFGWVMMFFRKDSKTLHDLLSRTAIVSKA